MVGNERSANTIANLFATLFERLDILITEEMKILTGVLAKKMNQLILNAAISGKLSGRKSGKKLQKRASNSQFNLSSTILR